MIRVLVVDDEPLTRAGLAMLLDAEADMQVVAEASDGAQACEETARHGPDVVVMDVRMPVLDGVEATGRVTADEYTNQAGGPVQVLILTAYHCDDAVYTALRAGASGFLLKDTAPEELQAAIRAVAAGDAWLQPAVARGLVSEFAARPDDRGPGPEVMGRLTTREREVLAQVARGLSNAEIAEHLVVSEVTVKTHLSRILMKLGLRDRAQAVVAAYESGLVTPGGDPPSA